MHAAASRLTAGVGLKPEHFDAALACRAEGVWFEVHAENYMVEGGPRMRWLQAIRAEHAISLHGVSLSLGSSARPDPAALAAFADLVERLQPALVSEHLAWSRFGEISFPDLLPCLRSTDMLVRIAANVSEVQEAIGRRLSIENPAHYLRLDGHDWGEADFLAELARRSGCGLLLDVNNVAVSCHNLGGDAAACIDAFPAAYVTEVHLAGHRPDAALGDSLWIDSHDAPVADAVWDLYERFIARAGTRPTLIERDANLPPFGELMRERERAAMALQAARPPASRPVEVVS